MSRFLEVVRFELRQALRRISTWVYFGIFFASALLMVHIAAGFFDGGFNERELVNSPSNVAMLLGMMNLLQLLVTAAIFGQAVYRDYAANTHALFFTTPVTRAQYLGGRFVGAVLVNLLIAMGPVLGYMLGSALPYLDAARFGPFRLAAYLQPLALLSLPNLLFAGAIFFTLAALTRQMMPNYVGGVLLLVGSMSAQSLLADLENRTLAALLDPFGLRALGEAMRYWTIAEQNTRLLPAGGLVLYNRLIWLGVGALILAIGFARFRFHQQVEEGGVRRRGRAAAAEGGAGAPAEAHARPPVRPLELPSPRRDFGWRAALAQYRSLAWSDWRGIVTNVYFRAIVAGGLVFMGVSAYGAGKVYGTQTLPLTYVVLEAIGPSFIVLMIVLLAFLAGEMVWRERDARIAGITDSAPTPTWVWFAAKLTALIGVVLVMQTVTLLFGIATQLARGFTDIDLALYLRELYGFGMIELATWAVLTLVVHVLANHKYLGHLLVVGYFLASGSLMLLGLEHPLFHFASGSSGTYSALEGYGYRLPPYAWLKLLWASATLLLALLGILLWVRGSESAWSARLRGARLRFRTPLRRLAAVASLALVGLGGFVYYNTNVLNEYRNSKQLRALQAKYEKQYKRFEDAPQPRITDADVRVEMYPESGRLQLSGRYWLANRTRAAIDSLHVLIPGGGVEIQQLQVDRPARRALSDEELDYFILRLERPLAPGDSLRLAFRLAYRPRGFTAAGVPETPLRTNGTFMNSQQLMPRIGYTADYELTSDRDRKKEGLQPKPRLPRPQAPGARDDNLVAHDADWLRFRATLGTSAGQVAIAPGELQRSWTEGGRRYLQYAMRVPMLNFYSINSASYAVTKDRWNDVAIEIYHHPEHAYNLERMARAVKRSLDYYTQAFGPYQHRQVRIVETTRDLTFAQSFAGTIPFSEGLGFIARVREGKDDIDYPFYVTAHEVAHQWWGHQVIGAAAQGSPLLMESLSEYSALMVMEREYGARHMRKFLKHLLDQYLSGRTMESKRETPLLYAEGQQYVHYMKGGLAFYTLREFLGEEKLNTVLRDYLERVRYQQAPYTTSLELYEHLKAATPDSLRPMLADLFEHITLYENRALDATSRRLPDGRYEVTLTLEAKKLRADSLGAETEQPMADWIDVGVFAAAPKGQDETSVPLYLRKHKLPAGRQTVKLVVDREPARAGVDPLHKLIDRHAKDNTVAVKRVES